MARPEPLNGALDPVEQQPVQVQVVDPFSGDPADLAKQVLVLGTRGLYPRRLGSMP